MVQKQPHIIMGHIIISPVPALSRAVLVDQAWFDPVYVQSSGSTYGSTVIINDFTLTINSYSAGIDFSRQNLTSTDVRF